MNTEKKLHLMKLAGMMRAARGEFSKANEVFEYLCELEDWYSTECTNRDYVIEDIIASVGKLALLMFDKEYGFDGRRFRDILWSYDTIELYAQGCLTPDQIYDYILASQLRKVDLDRAIAEISK
jgi:hypothetical protein